MVGDPVRAVEMEAPGPAPPEPAQATQFCHPLILWIWLFTVCADEDTEAAAKRNSATARMDKFLIVVFTITTFTPGDCFLFNRGLVCDRVGDYRRIYSGTTVFRLCARKVKIAD
jgi:hypothetical protein